jgi:hypothetical protein
MMNMELGVAVLQSKGATIAIIGCDLSSATTEEANEFRDTVADILKIDRAQCSL